MRHLVIALLLLGACGSADAFEPAALDWRPCGDDGAECATLVVPLDHGEPDGPTIDVPLARRRATGDRIGVLVVNYGGPGVPGVPEVRDGRPFADEVHERYDIVGFDPRGIHDLGCTPGIAGFLRLDLDPDDPARLDAAARRFAESCDDPILPHLGTVAVARDVDLLRKALGEERISWYGFSYGTAIGLAYAEAFGDHVHRMVLDGVVDPAQDLEAQVVDQAVAVEAALDDEGVYDLVERYGTTAAIAALASLYDPAYADAFVGAAAAAAAGDGSGLEVFADEYVRQANPGFGTAVTCLDLPRPDDFDAFVDRAGRATAPHPYVGRALANAARPCAHWPVPASGRPHAVKVDDPSGILVVGSTRDAITPIGGAVAVAAATGAELLRTDTPGHTSYGRDDAVDRRIHHHLLESRKS